MFNPERVQLRIQDNAWLPVLFIQIMALDTPGRRYLSLANCFIDTDFRLYGRASGPPLLRLTTSNGGITIDDADRGIIHYTINEVQAVALPAVPPGRNEPSRFVGDCRINGPSTQFTPQVFFGIDLWVFPGVTRHES